jgi:glycosyltransferase involved in cell wall biosynthesis
VRILFTIHHELNIDSGAPGVTMLLADALSAHGHEIEIYSFDDLPRVDERFKAVLFPAFVARHIRLRRKKFDLVDASTGDASALRRHPSGPALVTRSHGLEHVVHEALLNEVERGHHSVSRRYAVYNGSIRLKQVASSLRRADAVALLNRDELRYAVERLGVDPVRTSVIPHGFLPMVAPEELFEADDGPIGIAQVGSFHWRKGTLYAREALVGVLRKHRSSRAMLVGTGAERETVLATFPPDLRSRVGVVPTYQRSELPSLLAGCRIALFPSLAEGFPLGLVESMACGLAPVTTSSPGPRDIVRHGVDGLVVPPGDSAALEGAIVRLLGDEVLLQRLRHAAFQRASEFTWERTLALTEAMYSAAVERAAVR